MRLSLSHYVVVIFLVCAALLSIASAVTGSSISLSPARALAALAPAPHVTTSPVSSSNAAR